MRTGKPGLALIELEEGFREHAYFDVVGVKTIGFGTTSSVISPLPNFVTRAQGEALLRLYLTKTCEPALNALIAQHHLELNNNQFDALMDLGYNCGVGIYSTAYQIGRDLRAGNLRAVKADFGHYVYAGGHVLEDLVHRREHEVTLWDTPFVPPAPPDPHHYLWHPTSDRHGPGLVGGPFEVSRGRKVDERERVKTCDEMMLHPVKHRVGLGVVRSDLGHLADRVKDLLAQGAPPNDYRHLKARHDGLLSRSKGHKVA